MEAVQLDVVAHVDDRGDLGRRADPHQAGEEAGGADAAGQDGDQLRPLSRPLRRSRSASTMSRASASNDVRGSHPRVFRA